MSKIRNFHSIKQWERTYTIFYILTKKKKREHDGWDRSLSSKSKYSYLLVFITICYYFWMSMIYFDLKFIHGCYFTLKRNHNYISKNILDVISVLIDPIVFK